MTPVQVILLAIAITLPLVAAAVIGRLLLTGFRCVRMRRFGYVLLVALSVVGMLTLSAGIAAAWFGYAVAHSNKDWWQDAVLFAVSALLIHGVGFLLWRAARAVERSVASSSRVLNAETVTPPAEP